MSIRILKCLECDTDFCTAKLYGLPDSDPVWMNARAKHRGWYVSAEGTAHLCPDHLQQLSPSAPDYAEYASSVYDPCANGDNGK